ncbi:MAG: hypothetical protein OEV44_07065 [Spirochaetota bacterium]|nr:hypothetical protein [Spirochaetota bacterium]
MNKQKIIYARKWNFDRDEAIATYYTRKDIEQNNVYFKAYYEIKDSIKLIKLKHLIKKRFIDSLIEYFVYIYKDDLLIKKESRNRWHKIRWYNQYYYNEDKRLNKFETYILNDNNFTLTSYSLFYYDSLGRKNLRKVINNNNELNCYEVFQYDKNNLITKKELFDRDNNKMSSEIYSYDKDNKITEINLFNAEGNFEQTIKTNG